MAGATAVTIGNFDGAHRGHAALVRRARHAVGPGGRVVALVFEQHPLTVLRPGQAPPLLTTFARRAELLRSLGADEIVPLAPTAATLELSARAFIERLVAEWRPVAIVEGADFRFGLGREGDVRTLQSLGDELGFRAEIVEPLEAPLTDQSIVVVSSTIIRWLVAHGRVVDAALLLDRPYELAGRVQRGDRRGRAIGVPTANVVPAELLPADGVYAGRAVLADGRTFGAAIHIGPRATFDDTRRTVEAHLLDWSGPVAEGAEEYGWDIRLELVAWLRDQARFDSVPQLVDQIERDIARTREALARRERAPLEEATA